MREHHQRLHGAAQGGAPGVPDAGIAAAAPYRWLHAYHRQLVYCVLQFLHKDPGLAGAVVHGVLRRWPVTNCQKEVLLIDELEEIVDALGQHHFDALALPICSRIARCATSCSSQVRFCSSLPVPPIVSLSEIQFKSFLMLSSSELFGH
jgi:hypothetical protein